MQEERYVKKLTVKAWEGRMVGHGNDSKTYRNWESGTKTLESRNVTFIEIFPVKLNAFDYDHNDGNDLDGVIYLTWYAGDARNRSRCRTGHR